MDPADEDLTTLIERFVADYGPVSVTGIVAALGYEARRISEAMALLLDARRLVVAGVSPEDEPLYAVAAG
jgi:hypothetical protein